MSELNHVDPEPLEEPASFPTDDDTNSGGIAPYPFFDRILNFAQSAQRYSAYTFSGFLVLHGTAVILAPPVSIPLANEAIMLGRAIYQNPVVEPLFLGSALVHIASGLTVRLHGLYHAKLYYDQWKLPKLSPVSLSGYVLTLPLLYHYLSVRHFPSKVLGDSSFINLDYIRYVGGKSSLKYWIGFGTLLFFSSFHVVRGFKHYFRLYGAQHQRKLKTVFYGTLLAGIVSLIRIQKLPVASGYLAKQYELVYSALSKVPLL